MKKKKNEEEGTAVWRARAAESRSVGHSQGPLSPGRRGGEGDSPVCAEPGAQGVGVERETRKRRRLVFARETPRETDAVPLTAASADALRVWMMWDPGD